MEPRIVKIRGTFDEMKTGDMVHLLSFISNDDRISGMVMKDHRFYAVPIELLEDL